MFLLCSVQIDFLLPGESLGPIDAADSLILQNERDLDSNLNGTQILITHTREGHKINSLLNVPASEVDGAMLCRGDQQRKATFGE